MSWTGRAVELVNLGLSEADAYAFVAREREAADAGLPEPVLPAVVLEKLGQQQIFAPDCYFDVEEDRDAA